MEASEKLWALHEKLLELNGKAEKCWNETKQYLRANVGKDEWLLPAYISTYEKYVVESVRLENEIKELEAQRVAEQNGIPTVMNDMNGADLEQYQMWLEYQKPMAMNMTQDAHGIWGTCGRCGGRIVELVGLRGDSVVYAADPGNWPKYCGKCGQKVQLPETE